MFANRRLFLLFLLLTDVCRFACFVPLFLLLDGIVQHPSIQQSQVAVALSEDLSHPSLTRATNAVKALTLLGPAASSTVVGTSIFFLCISQYCSLSLLWCTHLFSSVFLDMLSLLECTAVAPSLVCNALAQTSTKHDRTGELELANLVETATRPEVRLAASNALGQLFKQSNRGEGEREEGEGEGEGATTVGAGKSVQVSVAYKTCSVTGGGASTNSESQLEHQHIPRQQQPLQPWSVQPVTLINGTSISVDGRHLLTALQAARSEQQRYHTTWWHSWNGTHNGYVRAVSGIDATARGDEEKEDTQYAMSLETFRALDVGVDDVAAEVRASCVLSIAMACADDPSVLTTTGTLNRIILLLDDANDVARASAAEAIGRMGAEVLQLTSARAVQDSVGMLRSDRSSKSSNSRGSGVKRRYTRPGASLSTPRRGSGRGSGRTPSSSALSTRRGGRSDSTGGGGGAFTPGSTRFIRSRQGDKNSSSSSSSSLATTSTNVQRNRNGSSNTPEHPVLATLQRLLKDRRHRVRHSVCVAIGHLGAGANAIAMDVLRAMDGGKVQRTTAAKTLVKLVPVGQQLLLDLLCNARCQTKGGEKTRVAACQGLAFLPVASSLMDAVVRVLFDTCQDPTANVRAAAVLALGSLSSRTNETVTYLKSRSLLPFVYSHLKDADQIVRLASAQVLANSAPQGEMLLIEGLLQDKEEKVRVAITHGLKHVGPRSIRTLLLAMRDRSKKVRDASANVVVFFGVNGIGQVLMDRPTTARTAVVHELKSLLQNERVYPDGTSQVLLGLIGRFSGFTVYNKQRGGV